MVSPGRKIHAFGQNFLCDSKIIDAIQNKVLDEVVSKKTRTIVEIGPGDGALTIPIYKELQNTVDFDQYLIFEIDYDLIKKWEQWSKSQKNVRVVSGDFVKIELPPVFKQSLVFSNLPYASATPIVKRLSKISGIEVMILMFQAEVAKRLYASPGTKSWGVLSLMVQNEWIVEPFLKVPPSSFRPAPKVDSEVIVLRPRSNPMIDTQHWEIFKELVELGFSKRRKTFSNGLSQSRFLDCRDILLEGFDTRIRAEALSWEDWQKVAQRALKFFSTNDE